MATDFAIRVLERSIEIDVAYELDIGPIWPMDLVQRLVDIVHGITGWSYRHVPNPFDDEPALTKSDLTTDEAIDEASLPARESATRFIALLVQLGALQLRAAAPGASIVKIARSLIDDPSRSREQAAALLACSEVDELFADDATLGALAAAWCPAHRPLADFGNAGLFYLCAHRNERMPKRSNEKQQVIEMLKSLVAPHGSTVTPSKMMAKHGSNKLREVDVVIEYVRDGTTKTHCFEIVGAGRRATIEWIEQMIGKHFRMPTDHLYLVSWSGFTKDCIEDTRAEDWITLVTPQRINGIVTPSSEELVLALRTMRFSLSKANAPVVDLNLSNMEAKSTTIYSSAGKPHGTAWTFGNYILQQPSLWQSALDELSKNAKGEQVTWGDLHMPATCLPPDLWLRATDELLPVATFRMIVGMQFKRQQLSLEARQFHDQPFAHTTAEIVGKSTLIVADLADDLTVKKVLIEPNKSVAKKGGRRSTRKQGTQKAPKAAKKRYLNSWSPGRASQGPVARR